MRYSNSPKTYRTEKSPLQAKERYRNTTFEIPAPKASVEFEHFRGLKWAISKKLGTYCLGFI